MKQFNVRLFVFLFIYIIGFQFSNAQNLSLEDAIQIGLQNQYSIKISKKKEDQAKNDNTLGNAGFLPTITGTSNLNYTISGIDQSFFGGLRAPLVQTGVESNNSAAGVTMAWTLYDGKGMFVLRNRLRELEKLGTKQTEGTIEGLIAQISTGYYEIIRQNLRLNNFKKGLEISEDRLKLAKDRFEVGQGSKVDFYSAQVDFNEDKAALLAQEQTLKNTNIGFNNLLVRDLHTGISILPNIDLMPKLNLEELKTQALSQNPQIISSLINKTIVQNDIDLLKTQQHPQIELVTGYNTSQVKNGAGFGVEKGISNVFNYGLRATINIFDGSNQKRKIQNAKINAEIAEMQYQDLRNNLVSTLERTYQTYQNALNLIQLENENYLIAKQNIDIAFDRYKVGFATSYELREVQRNAVAAETRLIEAKFNAKSAEIELIRLSGTLVN